MRCSGSYPWGEGQWSVIATDSTGAAILAKVLERYPVERIGEREAA